MAVTEPNGIMGAWGDAFKARDLARIMELYEPGCAFVSNDGAVLSGTDAIRGVMSDFLASDPDFQAEDAHVAVAGDVALVQARWKLRAKDGSEVTGRTADVLRRQPDG